MCWKLGTAADRRGVNRRVRDIVDAVVCAILLLKARCRNVARHVHRGADGKLAQIPIRI